MLTQDRSSLRHDQVARALLTALLYAAPVLMCLYMFSSALADPDIWWHLRTGEWIVRHHAVPRTDPFSTFGAGKSWQAYSWLFELLVLRLYQWFGLCGIMAYTGALVLAITVAVHHLMKRLQTDFTKSALLTMAVMISISRLYMPRPWLFTILFFVLEIDLLMNARKTGTARGLFWLPPIFALWANIHIQFIDGLLVLGVAACEPVLAHWWNRGQARLTALRLWTVFVGCVLATLVNPYGVTIYKVAYNLASQRGVLNKVSELQAIPFRNMGDFLLLFLALARRRARLEAAAFRSLKLHCLRSRRSYLSARSETCGSSRWLPARSWPLGLLATRNQNAGCPHLPCPSLAVATAGFVFAGAILLHVNNSHLRAVLAENMPVRAVEIVKERGYCGALYNDYGWGGFMIWNLRMPVSIDGRAALQGDERINRSTATWNGDPKWASDPDLSSAGLVIAPVKEPLTQLLRMDPRFELAFEDKVAAVFIARRNHAHAAAPLTGLSPIARARQRGLPPRSGISCASC